MNVKPAPASQQQESVVQSMHELGALIRRMRKDQNLTQEDISGLAGLGNRFIIDLERGKETVQAQKVLDVLALLGLEVVIRKV
jgi:HTH-type transcriptional regulator / antitoxin HipB